MHKQQLRVGARLLATAACAALLTGLAACGRNETPTPPVGPPASGSAAPAAKPDAATAAQAQARNAYNKAYNALIDDNRSVGAKYRSYLKMNVMSKSPSGGFFYGSPSDVESILAGLRTARAAGSGDAPLDASVDGLVQAGEKLVAIWTPLDPYYQSKGYLEDKWVKAREVDGDLRAGFTGLLTANDRLGSELDRVQEALRAERMAKLKEQGDMLGYQLLATMAGAKKFTEALDKTEGLKNKEAVAQVDARASELQALLAEYNKALADAKAEAKDGKEPHYSYATLHDKLQSMIGMWRTYKESKLPSSLSTTVGYYNDAVGTYNSGFGR